VRVIAKRFGVNPGTVQRISRPFDGAKRRRRLAARGAKPWGLVGRPLRWPSTLKVCGGQIISGLASIIGGCSGGEGEKPHYALGRSSPVGEALRMALRQDASPHFHW
jgi:hypothetical protein